MTLEFNQPDWQSEPNMQKTKVLVVDDEPSIRNVCSVILRKNGFDPLLATDGLEGLSTFEERHEEICLVLSDIVMPRMDGIEMARMLFVRYDHPNIIMMSGHHMSKLLPEDLKRLCSIIQKPFTANGLVEAVRKCLHYQEEHHPDAH